MTDSGTLITKIEAILDGIDREDSEPGGWWETSTGREFGEQKLKEVADAIREADTSTDDELGALTYLITAFRFRERGIRGVALEPDLAVSRPLAAFLLGEGFRRSEEPSGDEKIEWPDHWTINEKLRDLHARWHDQKGNLLGREACGWEGCEFWDSAQFALRMADVKVAGREPQGEPSDAQAERARIIADLREWSRPLGNSPEEETLRLVIDRIEHAAGGVR